MENNLVHSLPFQVLSELFEPSRGGFPRRVVQGRNDVASREVVVSDVDDLDLGCDRIGGGGDGGGGRSGRREQEGGELLRRRGGG